MSIIASAQSIAADARRLVERVRADGDVSSPPILGEGAESIVRGVLGSLLPARFGLGTGVLVSQSEELSAQIDAIIYDVWHSRPLPTATPRYPLDTAMAAIEIKRTLKQSDLVKAARDAARIKLMTRHAADLGTLPPDGGGVDFRRAALPCFTQCSVLGVSASASLLSCARYWQRHYCDVPFGCQFESLVVLDKGIVTLAVWHPGTGWPRASRAPVLLMDPGHVDPSGASVLLFPIWTGRGGVSIKSIRMGPRVPWAVGSALFLGVTDCGFHALAAWLRLFMQFSAGQLAPSLVPLAGAFSDGFPDGTSHQFLPIAITADPERLGREGAEYASRMTVELLRWPDQPDSSS